MTEKRDEVKKKPSGSMLDDPECNYRIITICSYFVILVLIGIPVWWYTTRVYRAALPLEKMHNLSIPIKADKIYGIPLSLEYDVLITIVNPDPETLSVDVKGEELELNLRPFLENVSSIADFVVKSQWLYLVNFGAFPKSVGDHYALNEEHLPHLITPLETRLWSHLSSRPCLNLVLYVSNCAMPLFIYDKYEVKSHTNAFLSPRWGGLYVVNPDPESCSKGTYRPDMQTVTSTFVAQLKKMLKMQDLASLQRSRLDELLESTRRTLASLAQLLSEISNIVISDDVANKIELAVESTERAELHLANGEIVQALELAKVAFKNSEAAFSDPSLLAMLYFPEDQKYAVYIPLFLPVVIPVLMSFVTISKWYKECKSKQRKNPTVN